MLVVLHHSFPLRLGGWAVSMFFVLSGYWIAQMWKQKYYTLERPFSTYIVSRWWRIAPVFFAAHAIAICINATWFRVGNSAVLSQWSWWLTQPCIAGNSQFGRLLPPSWSLDVEMQFYVLAPCMITGIIAIGTRQATILAAILVFWGLLQINSEVGPESPRLDVYLGYFAIGILGATTGMKPSKRLLLISIAGLIAILAILIVVPEFRPAIWRVGSNAGRLLESIIQTIHLALAFLGVPLALWSVHQRSGEWDRLLGDLSFPLYMFHWITREWYYQQVDWNNHWSVSIALLASNCIFAFLGAFVLLILIDRPSEKYRRAWLSSCPRKPTTQTAR